MGFSRRCSFGVSLLLLTACVKRIPVRGMVLGVNTADQTVTISHRDIPNYMPAMSMPFRVRKPADLAGLYPGAQVEFVLSSPASRAPTLSGCAASDPAPSSKTRATASHSRPIRTKWTSAPPCRTSR